MKTIWQNTTDLENLFDGIKCNSTVKNKTRGQTVGVSYSVTAEHEDLGIKVISDFYRSQFKNKDLAIQAIKDIIVKL